jgi:hypothetical protein
LPFIFRAIILPFAELQRLGMTGSRQISGKKSIIGR